MSSNQNKIPTSDAVHGQGGPKPAADDAASTFSTSTFSSTKALLKDKFKRSSSKDKDKAKDSSQKRDPSPEEVLKMSQKNQISHQM